MVKRILLLLLALQGASILSAVQAPGAVPGLAAGQEQAPGSPQEIQATPPPFTDGMYPCTSCHDGKTVKLNTERRQLKDMHDDIVLTHGPASRWCLDCHDPDNRDNLRLASGERIEFTSSFLLCGQCHGDKYRDWKVGVHGKRTGSWNGQKTYLLCVNCHNPHSPHFKPLKPMPAPVHPESLRARKGGPR